MPVGYAAARRRRWVHVVFDDGHQRGEAADVG
jgi:hypothetical protein